MVWGFYFHLREYLGKTCDKIINSDYPTRIPIIDAVFSILYDGKMRTEFKISKKLD